MRMMRPYSRMMMVLKPIQRARLSDLAVSAAGVEAATSFVAGFEAPRDGNLFGPIVPVPDDASALDHLLGLTGRDPNWQA